MQNNFFNFWIKNTKVSFLLILFIFIYGLFSIIDIPKESAPQIKLWTILINTGFNGVNPTDIDKLVTEKIERKIKNISGIKKISSSSRTWISSVKVILDKDVNSTQVYNQIKNSLANISLPAWTEKPKLIESTIDNNFLFEALIFWKKEDFTDFALREKAKEIRNKLENNKYVEKIEIWWYRSIWWGKFLDENDFRIKVILNKEKLNNLNLSIHSISKDIRNSNKNTTLWKQYIDWQWYNMYIEWKIKNITSLLKTKIKTSKGSILLSDIAKIKKEYSIYRFRNISFPKNDKSYNFISLLFSKSENEKIVKSSDILKEKLSNILKENNFEWLDVVYSKDLWSIIKKDFKQLYNTFFITIILVFIILLIFIGFKESLISIILLPISFFLTFIILYSLNFSLNIITSFSLIIAFWIMIDTIIVIIEWVSEKRKQWFNQTESVLKALNEFKSPLISWSITTLIAAFPMMFFPWLIWKFVSYIPITIFITIVSTLIITLTISSVLFINLKNSKEIEKTSKVLLFIRKLRINFLWYISNSYKKFLIKILNSKKLIVYYITIPIILLFLSIVYLSPKIGFTMLPEDDNWVITINFNSKKWLSKEFLKKEIAEINNILNKNPEILFHYSTISNSNIFTYVELYEKKIREKNNQKTAMQLVNNLWNDLILFGKKQNFDINIKSETSWLNTSQNIWIKLIAETPSDFKKLEKIWWDIKNFLENIKWTKNVNFSLRSNNWNFVYEFDREKLNNLWLSTTDITNEIYFYINWLNAWTIKSNFENNKIVLYLDWFYKNTTPDEIENLIITTKVWKIRVWDFLKYKLVNWVEVITREDWKIFASISTDIIDVSEIPNIQKKLDNYIKSYNFPKWIFTDKWGEIEENREVLNYAIKSFFIAILLIFLVLVYQFKSYSQSLLVLYSVVITILWINIWLFITWNSYSMPFIIWFIALAWIVVNDAIILVDVLNKRLEEENCKTKEKYIKTIIEASQSRLQPIIVTTLTTILWISPLLFQDKFWETFSYTVLFGLSIWSFMTLIIIPIIYRLFYLKRFRK